MDDDAPLSALVTAKPSKVDNKKKTADDDTPLSQLAGAAKPSNKTPGKPKTKPGAPPSNAVPSKPKGAPEKRKRDSSSSSSSSYSSSSSGSDKPLKKKGAKGKILKKKTTDGEIDENKVKKKDRSIKEQVVADFLCRWWYVLPDWPPKEEAFYTAELDKQKMRKVKIEEWEWVAEIDGQNRKKVYELSQFRGVFRDQAGTMIDVRPQETCPCYSNMMKKELPDLYQMLVKAYELQLEDLKNSVYDETLMTQSLRSALNRAREKAHQAASLGSVAAKKR